MLPHFARPLGTILVLAATTLPVPAASPEDAPAAPEFTHATGLEWINSPPLTLADLRGSVVLIDFWTFDCWNCYRSFPWLRAVEERYGGRGLKVIGVHSPEFAHEKVRANVEAKVKEFDLSHPVMLDNDFSYWKALHNRYWPSYFLIDKQGRVRGVYSGETHEGDDRAREIERAIEALLAEPA
jgi:thiol-disulfide isomerase/thioredoxin